MNKIMIVGTFHFISQENGSNFEQQELLARREGELKELAARIAQWKPTKVVVEVDRDKSTEINAEYTEYLAGQCAEESEVGRLAFPIAKTAGLKTVECVDWMKLTGVEHSCGEVFERMVTTQPALAEELAQYQTRAAQPDLTKESVRDAYRRYNAPEFAEDCLALYVNLARVGAENYYGTGWLNWWYRRNLNIFANLCALAEGRQDERVLLLIGGAHKGILEQFIQNSRAFVPDDVLRYI